MANFIVKALTAGSGLSSKRLCGCLGWAVCLFCVMWCTIKNVEAPMVVDSVLIASTSLLGIDSVTGIWKRGENSHKVTASSGEAALKDEKDEKHRHPSRPSHHDEFEDRMGPHRYGEGTSDEEITEGIMAEEEELPKG